ncbi:phosphoglycerate kinase, partial [Candidatus Saccharibacteria bacterium]|nr:phosphoglycerate kinase [Candidatus Saccharibacteria bacterium]NCU40438.1 phosphoglycerate kinase [Candidatus Saccharibacteria bacterium]
PTLRFLLERGCKIVIVSHLGRPEGVIQPSMSLVPVARRLEKLLGERVTFVESCVGDTAAVAVRQAGDKSVSLLENLRFHPGEENNDPEFAQDLVKSSGADYFVQDGFGVVHRAHASTSAIAQFVPSVAGLLLEREYRTITDTMNNPSRPMVAIMGGAKIADKIKVVERFVELADKMLIGGAMANTFMRFRGYKTGKSLIEEDVDDVLQSIYSAVEKKVGKEKVDDFLLLPIDVAVGIATESGARRIEVAREQVGSDELILDIGQKTMEYYSHELEGVQTVVWNGPLGYTELPQFTHGSARMALELATHPEIHSIIGGGDTADFVLHWDANKGQSFSHVSTGGGASLELMAGDPMPGIEALLDA